MEVYRVFSLPFQPTVQHGTLDPCVFPASSHILIIDVHHKLLDAPHIPLFKSCLDFEYVLGFGCFGSRDSFWQCKKIRIPKDMQFNGISCYYIQGFESPSHVFNTLYVGRTCELQLVNNFLTTLIISREDVFIAKTD